jgi:hypothetical protein
MTLVDSREDQLRASFAAFLENRARSTRFLQGRPGYVRLTSLERQLRCRNCGARGRASLDVEFRPRD